MHDHLASKKEHNTLIPNNGLISWSLNLLIMLI